MPAASTIKVLLSAAFWEAAEEGAIDPGARIRAGEAAAAGGGGLLESLDPETAPTLADLDLLMLSVSDNAATNALIEVVGYERPNALATALGLGATALRRRMMDADAADRGEDNTTSASDLVRLLEAIARADGVSARTSRRIVAALLQSQHTDITARHLSAPSRLVACKQGMLDGVLHDAALIDDGRRRVALAVMSRPAAAPEALARLAARAYAAVTSP